MGNADVDRGARRNVAALADLHGGVVVVVNVKLLLLLLSILNYCCCCQY